MMVARARTDGHPPLEGADADVAEGVSQAILEAVFMEPGTSLVACRSLPVHPRPTERTTVLAALMVVMLLIGCTALILAVQAARPPAAPKERPVEGWVAGATVPGSVESSAAVPTVKPIAPPAAPTVMPITVPAAPPVEPVAAAPVVAVGRPARVANTSGRGVILHTEPRKGARTPAGLLEGASVILLDLSGAEWARVRSAQGQVGWVPTEYLAPTN